MNQEMYKIANELVNSGWIYEQCNQLCRDKQLMEDLAHDIIIIIMQYKNKDIITAYQKNEHYYLIKKIIYNQFFSVNSEFYYKYRKNNPKELKEEYEKEY